MTTATRTMEASAPWSDLLPDILGHVIALLPFPADRARFRAVCRAWHSAASQHIRQLPWIVLPSCSFCVVGDNEYLHRIPGVPKNATCLGAAADGWLAIDCTNDVFRRTPLWDKYSDSSFLEPRPDVKHRHAYLLYNPFSGKTVPLPELDSIIGHVAETFEIRKVLMCPSSTSADDIIVAVTTTNWNYNVILCRPGKGKCVVPNVRVFDVEFLEDKLYGITPEEELVAFDLDEDDEEGNLTVARCRRVIKKSLADGEEDPWSWLYDDDSSDDDDDEDDDDDDDDDENDDEDGEELAGGSDEEQGPDDEDLAPNEEEEDSFNGDDMVPNGEDISTDEEIPYEPKDYIVTTRCLVKSRGNGELLMVKHYRQSPPFTNEYIRKVEVFRADMITGKWVPVTPDAAGKGDALFLSRSFSKYTHAYGNIKEGHIYFIDIEQAFDTGSCVSAPFTLPSRIRREAHQLLTWLFPPELVV